MRFPTSMFVTWAATLLLTVPGRATQPTATPTPSAVPSFDECADPTGDGVVTVSDGVNVLRAAAELSSLCTPFSCDTNQSGTITVTDGVRTLAHAAGLATVTGCPVPSRIDDFSGFASFHLSRQSALGFCPPVGSVYAVAIERRSADTYRVRLSVTEERPAGDPDCLPFTAQPSEGRCLAAIARPERTMSADELQALRAAFTSVEVLERRDPFCAHGAIDPCIIHVFEWDDALIQSYPCTAPRLTTEEVSRLTAALDALIPTDAP